MTSFHDPFKSRSFGITKFSDEKKEKVANLTLDKRYYPTTQEGDFDEWAAITRQQDEMFGVKRRIELKKKRVQQEHFRNQYFEDQVKKGLNRSLNESIKTNDNYQLITNQRKNMKINAHARKESRNFMKNLANEYKDIVSIKRSNTLREKQIAKEEENRNLDRSYKLHLSNQFNNAKHLSNAYNDLTSDWRQRQDRKEAAKKMETIGSKKQFIQDVQTYNNSMAKRDQDYIEKFKRIDNGIKRNMGNYTKNILGERQTKSLTKISSKLNEVKNMDKLETYKDILDFQCQLNNKLKKNAGMTKEEKRINKQHLRDFKGYKHSNFSMMPGLHADNQLTSFANAHTKSNLSFDHSTDKIRNLGFEDSPERINRAHSLKRKSFAAFGKPINNGVFIHDYQYSNPDFNKVSSASRNTKEGQVFRKAGQSSIRSNSSDILR
ncbi:unnamed protein product [Moneuplotes crassus]|uniref:Uncharacterized protein n=1 Tax=Euplotes crassus TaxID=5936 RepID=A0AAD1UDH9_EUPCR|nr:unnamed protein product [Moneuplotes crassus]